MLWQVDLARNIDALRREAQIVTSFICHADSRGSFVTQTTILGQFEFQSAIQLPMVGSVD
jgi:hypothetical protein